MDVQIVKDLIESLFRNSFPTQGRRIILLSSICLSTLFFALFKKNALTILCSQINLFFNKLRSRPMWDARYTGLFHDASSLISFFKKIHSSPGQVRAKSLLSLHLLSLWVKSKHPAAYCKRGLLLVFFLQHHVTARNLGRARHRLLCCD